ncbi:MAG TPA: hypothetical protein VFB89_06315, partial [Gemmatimonadales bacterium]|nr:hypothetical protein [Gemmatimonadales bacterium]
MLNARVARICALLVFGLASMPAPSGARPFDVPGFGISVPIVRISGGPVTGTSDPLIAELAQSEA